MQMERCSKNYPVANNNINQFFERTNKQISQKREKNSNNNTKYCFDWRQELKFSGWILAKSTDFNYMPDDERKEYWETAHRATKPFLGEYIAVQPNTNIWFEGKRKKHDEWRIKV